METEILISLITILIIITLISISIYLLLFNKPVSPPSTSPSTSTTNTPTPTPESPQYTCEDWIFNRHRLSPDIWNRDVRSSGCGDNKIRVNHLDDHTIEITPLETLDEIRTKCCVEKTCYTADGALRRC
tara:strand:- start:98 stop:484 length:387 start_codon:yes stop_codon:yes gene_type:complete